MQLKNINRLFRSSLYSFSQTCRDAERDWPDKKGREFVDNVVGPLSIGGLRIYNEGLLLERIIHKLIDDGVINKEDLP